MQAESQQDPIKDLILSVLSHVSGRTGDIIIVVVLILTAFFGWKKMPRVAIGFFVLALGIVLLRVVISWMF